MIVVTTDASGAVVIPVAAQEAERHRVALVTALHLPPETTWEEALARVVPVAAEAKGCRGCGNFGTRCWTNGGGVREWIHAHLQDDDSPKPGAPECPGRVQKEQG